MKKTMIVLGIGLVLAAGCTAPPEYYAAMADRTVREGDAYLQMNPGRYAPEVVRRYTDLLARIPYHPAYDPIRERLERKREEAKNYSGGGASYWGSQSWAPSVEDVPRRRSSGSYRRSYGGERRRSPAEGSREPQANLNLNLALSSVTGKFGVDLEGRCTSVSPELTLESRLGKKGSRFSLAAELRGGVYSGDLEFNPFGHPGDTGCHISHFSLAVIGCVSTSRRTSKPFELLMGWKFTHLAFRGPSGFPSSSSLVPAFCFGFRFRVHVAKGFTMMGTLRPNFFILSRSSGSSSVFGLDAGVRAFIRLQNRLDLCLGVEWEGFSFSKCSSDYESTSASMDNEKYFLGLRFSF
ncbi:MAG: hypothetical protein ACYS47_03770 [Planctomycetota bacterium]